MTCQRKSGESHLGKSLFNLGFSKGRIMKCSFLCLLQLRQSMKMFNDRFFLYDTFLFPVSSLLDN